MSAPPMPIAVETLIIIIVIVSLTIVGSLTFALYWLWKLLIEDRRWARLHNCTWPTSTPQPWPSYSPVSSPSVLRHPPYVPLPSSCLVPDPPETVVTSTESHRSVDVPAAVLTVALVDEDDPPKPPPRLGSLEPEVPASVDSSTILAEVIEVHLQEDVTEVLHQLASEVIPNLEVVVLDGTEPPPPYEENR